MQQAAVGDFLFDFLRPAWMRTFVGVLLSKRSPTLIVEQEISQMAPEARAEKHLSQTK